MVSIVAPQCLPPRKNRDRQTDMGGPIRRSSVTLEREEGLKNVEGKRGYAD
jgi:hypothetical protein